MRAIGIVLQTKVFVDLKEALLVRNCLEELRAARIVAEKARRAGSKSSIRKARG